MGTEFNMKNKEIAFVSAKSRGVSPDLKLVKDNILKKVKDAYFIYYLNTENSKNEMVSKGAKYSKKKFCKELGNTICIDGSLPTRLAKTAREGAKILISVPYDYQYKAVNKGVKGKNTFKAFTHIIAGSPFGVELFKNNYRVPNAQIIEGVCTPFAWDLNQKEKQQEVKNTFLQQFPEMKDKKILSILLTGSQKNSRKNIFENVDWRSFLKTIRDDWFVFINNQDLLENTVLLNSKYTDCFGYVNKKMDARELMYFSDCLITNSGMYASYFSSKNKPLYCIKYSDNAFEGYMKKNYPSMFLKDVTEKTEMILKEDFGEEQKSFCEKFSYNTDINPADVIIEILNK